MRCTHYMKYEIIRNANKIMFQNYTWRLLHPKAYNQYVSEGSIINASIIALENKLSIDRIEVNDELRRKLILKASAMFHAKVLNI